MAIADFSVHPASPAAAGIYMGAHAPEPILEHEGVIQQSEVQMLIQEMELLARSDSVPDHVKAELRQTIGDVSLRMKTASGLDLVGLRGQIKIALTDALVKSGAEKTAAEQAVTRWMMIGDLSPEAQARIGIRSMYLTDANSYLTFARSFYDDLPEGQREYFAAQMANDLQNTEEGRQLSAALGPDGISQPSRAEVAAAEQRATDQATAIVTNPTVGTTPDGQAAQAAVNRALEDQALADPEIAEDVAGMTQDIEAGRPPSRARTQRMEERNAARQTRLEQRVARDLDRLPQPLQDVIERNNMSPSVLVNRGRDVMHDPAKRERAVAALRAIEAGQPLDGFSEQELQDAAALQAFASARNLNHLEDIVEHGQKLDRHRGRGQDRSPQPQPEQGKGNDQVEITDSTKAGHVKVYTADVTAMREMYNKGIIKDVDGNGQFDRKDIDAAMEQLRLSGVKLDADNNGRIDASALGQMPTVLSQQAQKSDPNKGRG